MSDARCKFCGALAEHAWRNGGGVDVTALRAELAKAEGHLRRCLTMLDVWADTADEDVEQFVAKGTARARAFLDRRR